MALLKKLFLKNEEFAQNIYKGIQQNKENDNSSKTIDAFFEKAVKLKPRVISFLIGVMNFTGKRFDMLKEAGYKIIWAYNIKDNLSSNKNIFICYVKASL